MNTKTKKDFGREGPELIEHDIIVYNACNYEKCSLCELDRQEKCNRIETILKFKNTVVLSQTSSSFPAI